MSKLLLLNVGGSGGGGIPGADEALIWDNTTTNYILWDVNSTSILTWQ